MPFVATPYRVVNALGATDAAYIAGLVDARAKVEIEVTAFVPK